MNDINLIYEARKKKGWTQTKLAEQLRVSQGIVSQWESGKSIPRVNMMKKIAKLLDVEVKDFFQ